MPITVTENIGRNFLGDSLPYGDAIRVLAAAGILFNIQVRFNLYFKSCLFI